SRRPRTEGSRRSAAPPPCRMEHGARRETGALFSCRRGGVDRGVASAACDDRTPQRTTPPWHPRRLAMNTIETLRLARYPTIRVEGPADGSAHWLYMHADAHTGIRPCCRFEMLEDMWRHMSAMTLAPEQRTPGRLRHFVLASAAGAYNLGGDLELFMRLIRAGNRDRLLAYARRCVEGVHHLHTGFGGDVHTVALVQGDALGGGLEMALACHTIVAEEGVGMGLPEVLFGLFPGMG